MIIHVDLEGRSVIEQLCDIALKEGGVKNLNAVNKILKSVILLPPVEKDQDTSQPKSPIPKEETVEPKVEKAKKQKEKQKEKTKTKKEKPKKREPMILKVL